MSAGIFPNSSHAYFGDPVDWSPNDHVWLTTTAIIPSVGTNTSPTVTTPASPNAKVAAELEVLKEAMSHCMACGEEAFILCPLCREAIKEIRNRVLTEALESMRPE